MASKSAGKSWPECGESRTSGTAGFIAVGYLNGNPRNLLRQARGRIREDLRTSPSARPTSRRCATDLPALFAGKRVLEIACGTGYWTPLIAAQRRIGRGAGLQRGNAADRAHQAVSEEERHASSRAMPTPCPAGRDKFAACFAGFWWSHVPLARLDALPRGAEAPSGAGRDAWPSWTTATSRAAARRSRAATPRATPTSSASSADGTSHEVLKNFPTARADGEAPRPPRQRRALHQLPVLLGRDLSHNGRHNGGSNS